MREPKERVLPNDLQITLWATTVVGYWFGSGTAVLAAGATNDPAKVIGSGALIRNAWIGTLAGFGTGLLYSIFRWLRSAPRPHGFNSNDETEPASEYERQLFFPSTQKFLTLDIQLLITALAGSILGSIIMTNTGSIAQKAFGDVLGRGVGAFAGTIIGLFFLPIFFRLLSNKFTEIDIVPIAEKKWYTESRHNVPFYVRLFFGFWTGYVALSLLSTPQDENGFIDMDQLNRDQLLGTVFFGIAAYLSPFFFAIVRYCLKPFISQQNNNDSDTSPQFKPIRWYTGTRMDIPWYVRIFLGVIAGATIGLVEKTYRQADQIDKGWVYAIGALSWASPMLLSLFDLFVKLIGGNTPSHQPPPVKLSYDMPWYMRLASSLSAGAMLGDVLFYTTTDADSYNFKSPPSQLPRIFMWTIGSLAYITPLLMTIAKKCGFKHRIFNPTSKEGDDLHWPWHTRLLGGLWLGALCGGAIAYFAQDTNDKPIIPGNIGPDFLDINNAYGTSTGGLAGAAFALLWPIARWGWERVTHRYCKTQRTGFFSNEYSKNTYSENEYVKDCYSEDGDTEDEYSKDEDSESSYLLNHDVLPTYT